jgi:hypothetical protein
VLATQEQPLFISPERNRKPDEYYTSWEIRNNSQGYSITLAASEYSMVLKLTNWGFEIPPNMTVTGVEVSTLWKSNPHLMGLVDWNQGFKWAEQSY